MTTNQEGRQAAIRDSTSSAYGVAADWHALFDDAGISAGTFNERLLAWINAELSASHSNLVSAMQAYAEDAGYDGWEDMATLVLAMNGAETLLDGETQGLAFDFTDQSALIIDTGTPANNYDSTGIVSSGSLVGPSGKLTYTSPSNKLVMQSDGYYKYSAHNLILQSETIDNAYWAKTTITVTADADGTSDLITETGSGATLYNNSPNYVTVINGGTYVLKWRVKASANVQWVRVIAANNGSATQSVQRWFDIQNGVVGSGTGGATWTYVDHTITDAGNGYYDCTLVFTTSDSALSVWINSATADGSSTRGSSSAYYIAHCHVYRYPAVTDYIRTTSASVISLPYEWESSGGACKGLLVEEARTNLALRSIEFTNAAWSNVNTTDAADSTTSPDGTTNADTVLETVTSAKHTIYTDAITISTATNYTISAYVKSGLGRDYITLQTSPGISSNYAATTFYLSGAGSVTQTTDLGQCSTTSSGISSIGNGWYRIHIVIQHSATGATYPQIGTASQATFTPDTSGFEAFAGDTAKGFYIYGFQVEAGSFPTSPIITYGSTATRAADHDSQLTSTFPLSATAGTLYVEATPLAGADLAGVVSLNDGTGNEEIVIYKDASANILAQVEDGGVNQLAPLDSTVNAASATTFKAALAYAANDFALSADGTAAQTDTGGTLPTVTTLEIGADQANNYFNGHIKAIAYVPRRKSDSELQTETT